MARKKKRPGSVPRRAAGVQKAATAAAPATVTGQVASGAEAPASTGAGPALARRDFLATAGKLVTATVGGVALAGGLLAALPSGSARQDYLQLGDLASFPFGTLVFLPGPEVFVRRGALGLGAFSARCTHLGCTVRRASGGFECPCHGARYDELGRLLAGPARRDLDWYRLYLDETGQIWLDRSRTVPAGTWTALEPVEAES